MEIGPDFRDYDLIIDFPDPQDKEIADGLIANVKKSQEELDELLAKLAKVDRTKLNPELRERVEKKLKQYKLI